MMTCVYYDDVCHNDDMCHSDKVRNYDDCIILNSRVFTVIHSDDKSVIMTPSVIRDDVSL